MTQRSIFFRISGIVRSFVRVLDVSPERPLFDTYGPHSRTVPSFTQKLFLS